MQRFLSTHPYSRILRQLGSIACAALFLAACSSGGGDGGGGTPPAAAPTTGTFVDSPVDGLHFTSPPSNPAGGFTSGGGLFQCQSGDSVTFDLGGKVIGTPQLCSSNAVTAVSVLGATSATDPSVVNLSQLLLTLGPIVNNVIQIPQPLPAGFNGSLVPAFNDPNFDTAVMPALPTGTTLVSNATADAHLATSFKTLSVTIVNSGTVKSEPPGINCTVAKCFYDFVTDTAVTLTATGAGFTGWSGAGCSGTGTCVVTLNANAVVIATFPVAPPPSTLSVTKLGSGGGTVTSNPAGITCGTSCSAQFPASTPVTLTATADVGSTFTGWSNGTGSANCTGTGTCAVILNADSTITATFTLNTAQFSVTAIVFTPNSGGGNVLCSANGGPAATCGTYPVGTNMTLTAAANSASNFGGWSGGTGSASSCLGTAPCSFPLNGDSTVTANFHRPTLSVVVVGTGSVTSSPAGINNCGGGGLCFASFDKTTVVTLTVSGTGFTGWSGGGCSGTGTCPVTLLTDTGVTANFGQVTTSTRWLFYTDNAGTIKYADPANPGATTTPLTTTATTTILGGTGFSVFTGAWDSTKSAYTNLTTPYLTYFSGGKLWRVSTVKSSGVPGSGSNLPVQISNESAALMVCDMNQIVALTVLNSKLWYELPGADNNCLTKNDNVTKSVVVSDGAGTPPTIPLAPGSVVTGESDGPGTITDLTTGSPTHIFIVDHANSDTLKLMNLTTNDITTIQTNVGEVDFLAQDTSDRVFLQGGPARNILYIYDKTGSANSLVTLVTGASELRPGRPAGDGTNLYIAEQANGKLYKVPMTATASTDVITLLTNVGFPLGDPCGIDDVVVTTNNVFLHTYVPGSGGGGCTSSALSQDASGLYRVSKTTGTLFPIITHATGTGVFSVLSVNSLLYYNHFVAFSVPQANIINENGTSVFSSPTTCPGGCAGWGSILQSPSFFVRTSDEPVSKVILTTFAGGTQNGATLSAFDAPTGTQGATLGVVPATTPSLDSLFGFDLRDTVTLLVGQQSGSPNPNNFLFFVDTVLPGSLTQIPTGTAAPWFPTDFF